MVQWRVLSLESIWRHGLLAFLCSHLEGALDKLLPFSGSQFLFPQNEGFGLDQYCSRPGPWTSGVNNIWELARNALSDPVRDLLNLGWVQQSVF